MIIAQNTFKRSIFVKKLKKQKTMTEQQQQQQQQVPPLETEIVYFRNDAEFKYLIGFLFYFLNSCSIQ